MSECVLQETKKGWWCPICDKDREHLLNGNHRRRCRTRKIPRTLSQEVTDCKKGCPGAELKKILARFGIRPGKNCKCERRARIMDQRGPEWCRKNIDEIVGWLKEEANRRKLPFINRLGKYLVNKAIKNSLKSGET